jgi:hypothetical protein
MLCGAYVKALPIPVLCDGGDGGGGGEEGGLCLRLSVPMVVWLQPSPSNHSYCVPGTNQVSIRRSVLRNSILVSICELLLLESWDLDQCSLTVLKKWCIRIQLEMV